MLAPVENNPIVPLPREVLIVEDEQLARDSLARILSRRDYQVTQAKSGSQAVLEAKKGSVTVVLMDIRLGGKLDGIEAAEKIQKLRPLTSFIFVSAYAHEQEYRERARKKKIRAGGWIEKPFEISDLIQLIDYEREKLEMLASLQVVSEHGEDAYEYLSFYEGSLSQRLVEELREELHAENDIVPLQSDEEIPDMEVIAREIDKVYGQIEALITRRIGDPSLKAAVRPLRERLRTLQEREAEAMEFHFRSKILYDPREGRELLKQVKKRLG